MNDVKELKPDELQLIEMYRALSEPDKKLALVSFSQARTSSTLFTGSFKNATNVNIVIGGAVYMNGKEQGSDGAESK